MPYKNWFVTNNVCGEKGLKWKCPEVTWVRCTILLCLERKGRGAELQSRRVERERERVPLGLVKSNGSVLARRLRLNMATRFEDGAVGNLLKPWNRLFAQLLAPQWLSPRTLVTIPTSSLSFFSFFLF